MTLIFTGSSSAIANNNDNKIAVDYRTLSSQLSPLIEKLLDKHNIVGLSLALVDEDRIAWSDGFGHSDDMLQTPTTANTPFRVGSITKIFTALSTLKLQDENLIDIDQPLSAYLERFSMKSRFSNTAPITVRNILTHHAGIPTDLYKGQWNKLHFTSVVEQLRNEYVSYPPEFVKSYSNVGFSLLGHMIEKVSKESYENFIDDAILKPLYLQNTGFHPGRLYFEQSKAFDAESVPQTPLDMRDIPAMGLYSSANDLAKFLRVFTDRNNPNHQSIISDASLEEMFEHQNADIELDFDDKVGITWVLDQCGIVDSGLIAEHGGTTMYFSSQMMLAKDYEMGVVVLANTQGSRSTVNQIAEFILKAALEIKHGAMQPHPPQIAQNYPSDAAPNPYTVGGEYVTDLGLVSLNTTEQELCACSRKKVIDLVPLPNGWFNIQQDGKATIDKGQSSPKVAGKIVGEHKIIIVKNKQGRTHRFGTIMPEQGIPKSWQQRLGAYQIINPDQEFPVENLSLNEQENRLYLRYQMPRLSDKVIELPLSPISDLQAVTVGLGRTRGETIQIEPFAPEQEHLLFSGLIAKKITAE